MVFRQFKNDTKNPDNESDDHRGYSAFAVDTLRKNTQKKNGGNRRGKIGLNALQVLIESIGDSPHNRYPCHTQNNDNCSGDAAYFHQFLVGGLRFNFSIDIQRKQR